MASWEPDEIDVNTYGTGDEEYEWSDDLMKDLEIRFNKLRQFNRTLYGSHDDDNLIDITTKTEMH